MLLLRVGIDSGCGGTLGPLFPDRTFEYVPIPEHPVYAGPKSVYYYDLPARHGGTLAQYVPRRYSDSAAHYDPEFETFTYGDPTRNKRAQLLRLKDGDLLVFYAGLRPVGDRTGSRLYIIGYFTVASVESIETTNPWPPPNASRLLGNAHFRRRRPEHGLVVVRGHRRDSRLLERAIMISDGRQHATPEIEKRLGIRGSLMRAIGRWVPSDQVVDAVDWIVRSGSRAIVHETRMRTLIYKRTHSGDPDPRTGTFGNHNCMGSVRGWLYDAVIGVGGTGRESECNGIGRKLTWIGIGPENNDDTRCPTVTFDHFLYYGENGPFLKDVAPALAKRMYDKKVRVLIDSLSFAERREVDQLLDCGRNAPPSAQRKSLSQRAFAERGRKYRSISCRRMSVPRKAEQENPADARKRRS